jgi:transcriptional regulator with XRE-family HTH domain
MDNLPNRLRRARERAGLMQFQLAAALKVRPSAVSHWETGRRRPRTDLLTKIAELTRTDIGVLLNLANKATPAPIEAPKTITVPTWHRNLEPDERLLVYYYRGLPAKGKKNLLKVLGIAFHVVSKDDSEAKLNKSRGVDGRH